MTNPQPSETPDPTGLPAVTPLGAGEVSPAGKVFQASVSAMLAAEFDRRKTLEARGATLLTSTTSVTTIIFALTVLVTGRDAVLANHWAVYVLIASLSAFLVSALLGIVIQTGFQPSSRESVVSAAYLQTLTTDELWGLPADEVVRRDVAQKVMAIGGGDGTEGLRGANAAKARWIKTGVRFQLGGVALLAATMGLELWTRLR